MIRRLSQRHRTAFVSGASAGLGHAFTEMLLAEGLTVWGTSRDPSRLRPASADFRPVALDLARPEEAEAAFARASGEAGGPFDLVINNAGFGIFGEFASVGAPLWAAQLEAMVGGTLRLAHAAWRGMRARNRGCLVNVSSLAAEFPLPFMTGYNMAKSALSALSESLILESRESAVRVIDFCPGDYRTGFNRAMEAASPGGDGRAGAARAWRRIEEHLEAGPPPAKAAADLRRALLRDRSGRVRSGTFFQARFAPLVARLVPAAVVRSGTARYFGLR